MANRLGTTPSTKARQKGYGKLHGLKLFLFKMLENKQANLYVMKGHWLDEEFIKLGWKNFINRFTPKDKLGGPEIIPPSKSKRRQQKKKDRKATIR